VRESVPFPSTEYHISSGYQATNGIPSLVAPRSVEQSSRTSSLGSDSRPAVVPQAPTPTPPQEAAAPRAELGHAASPSLGKRKASDDAGDAKAGGGEPQRHQKRKIEYAAVLQPSGTLSRLGQLLQCAVRLLELPE